MSNYHFNLVFRPESEGGYTVIVPALPGCITYGKTLDEAKAMAKDAIEGYLASQAKHSEEIRDDAESLISSLDLEKNLQHA